MTTHIEPAIHYTASVRDELAEVFEWPSLYDLQCKYLKLDCKLSQRQLDDVTKSLEGIQP